MQTKGKVIGPLAVPNLVDRILAYEGGTLSEEDTVAFFQDLVDYGTIRHLQGSYQRMAASLIDAGLVTRRTNG